MHTGMMASIRAFAAGVRGHVGRLAAMAAVAYAMFIAFPLGVAPIRSGIDPSWMYTLNSLPGSGYLFGQDILFTYGPLGFLLAPLDIGVNATVGLGIAVFSAVLFGVVACRAIAVCGGTIGGLSFAVALLLAAVLGLQYESMMLLTLLTLALLSFRDKRYGSEFLVLASNLSAGMIFLKFNLGVATVALCLAAAVGRLVAVRPVPWRSAIVSVLAMAGTAGLLGFLTMRTLDNAIVWARGSIDISVVYDVSQSIHGPTDVLILGCVSIAIGLLVTLSGAFSLRGIVPALLSALVLVAAFKHGFVRQDLHVLLFFPVVVMTLGIGAMFADKGRLFALWPVAIVFTALLGVPAALFYNGLDYWSVFEVLRGGRTAANLAYFLNPDETARLAAESRASLSPMRLPDEWLRTISQAGGKVDVLPYESSICVANNLPCVPTEPAYVLSSPELDLWNANRYAKESAPAFLIVEFPEMDGRNPVQSMPRTWSTILDRYEAAPVPRAGQKVLLRRRVNAPPSVRGEIGDGTIRAGEVLELPQTDRLLYASFDLKLKRESIPIKAVFRIPPVELEASYSSGRIRYFRLLPGPSGDGVPLNVLPRNTAEFADLLAGRVQDPVTSVRLLGEGVPYFEEEIHYRLEQSTYGFTPGGQLVSDSTADLPDPTSFQIFYLNENFNPRGVPGLRVSRAGGKPLRLTGWAIDDLAWRPASGIVVRLDGQTEFPATYGLENKDVARILQNPEFRLIGFEAEIPIAAVTPGRHTVELRIRRTDGQGYYDTGPVLTFVAD